ncbi:hypothetical protein Hanom_Chr13g01194351 [Helianthus anomalus]
MNIPNFKGFTMVATSKVPIHRSNRRLIKVVNLPSASEPAELSDDIKALDDLGVVVEGK